jgi:hypothetical protein
LLDGVDHSNDEPDVTKNLSHKPLPFEEIVSLEKILALEWYPRPTDSQETWDRAWNRIQVIAAFNLIYHFFGEKWYNLVFREIADSSILKDRAYLRYVKRPRIHPLTEMALTGRPEMDIRILRLGEALKMLGFPPNDTNLSVKLDELRSDSFAAAYFELKIAFIYARSGFDVKFLKPAKASKCPDLHIERDSVNTVVECKKRRPESASSLPARIGGVIDRLRDANQQIATVSNHGVVYIEVEDNLDRNGVDSRAYVSEIVATLPDLSAVSCAILCWEKISYPRADLISLSTEAVGILNKNSSCPFPRDVWCNPAALASPKPTVIVDLPPPMRTP